VEDLVDAVSDQRVKKSTATQMLSLLLHQAINGVLNSMDQLRFPNNLEVETGKPQDAENASKLPLKQTFQDLARLQLLFLKEPTTAHQTILHAMDKLTSISPLQVSITQQLPGLTLVINMKVNKLFILLKPVLTG
jgi:hypothetical protein